MIELFMNNLITNLINIHYLNEMKNRTNIYFEVQINHQIQVRRLDLILINMKINVHQNFTE